MIIIAFCLLRTHGSHRRLFCRWRGSSPLFTRLPRGLVLLPDITVAARTLYGRRGSYPFNACPNTHTKERCLRWFAAGARCYFALRNELLRPSATLSAARWFLRAFWITVPATSVLPYLWT